MTRISNYSFKIAKINIHLFAVQLTKLATHQNLNDETKKNDSIHITEALFLAFCVRIRNAVWMSNKSQASVHIGNAVVCIKEKKKRNGMKPRG